MVINHAIEKEIVRTFVVKEKQDRALWELSGDGSLGGLCHPSSGVLKKACLHPVKCLCADDLADYVIALGAKDAVYFLGYDKKFAFRASTTIQTALNGVLNHETGPYLVYFGNGVAYCESEIGCGKGWAPERYILLAEGKKFFSYRD